MTHNFLIQYTEDEFVGREFGETFQNKPEFFFLVSTGLFKHVHSNISESPQATDQQIR